MRLLAYSTALALILATHVAPTAWAGDNNGPRGGDASAAAAASASSSSRSSAKATGIGVGVGVGIANSGGQSTSVTNSTSVDAEPAIAPNVALTSANCIGSVGAGIGAGGVVSLGFGTTIADDDCFKMELAKIYFAIGNPTRGYQILESTRWVQDLKHKAIEKSEVPGTSGPLTLTPKPNSSSKSDDLGCKINPSLARRMGIDC